MPALLSLILALSAALVGCGELDEGSPAGLGGSASETAGCIEESTPLAQDDETELNVTAGELFDLVGGDHVTQLHWTNLADSRLALKITPLTAAYIHSRFKTQQELAPNLRTPTQQCSDYVRVQAALEIHSADGRLAEVLPRVELLAYGPYEVRGTVQLEATALKGQYTPVSRTTRCFVGLRIRFVVERNGTGGSISELIGPGACTLQSSNLTPFAGGSWGARWQNY